MNAAQNPTAEYLEKIAPLIGSTESRDHPFYEHEGRIYENLQYACPSLDDVFKERDAVLAGATSDHDRHQRMIKSGLRAIQRNAGYGIGAVVAHCSPQIGSASNTRSVPGLGQVRKHAVVNVMAETYDYRRLHCGDPSKTELFVTSGMGTMSTMCAINGHIGSNVVGVHDPGGGILFECPDILPPDWKAIWEKHGMRWRVADIPMNMRRLCWDILCATKRTMHPNWYGEGAQDEHYQKSEHPLYHQYMSTIESMIGKNLPFLKDDKMGIRENPKYAPRTLDEIYRDIDSLGNVSEENPEYPFREALKLAMTSVRCNHGYAIGALITVHEGGRQKILTRGENKRTTVDKERNPYFEIGHAEVDVVDKIWGLQDDEEKPVDPKDITLHSTVEPCPMCTSHAISAGIGTILTAVPDPGATSLLDAPNCLPPDLKRIFREHDITVGMGENISPRIRLLCWEIYLASTKERHKKLHGTK